jgi:hypothetical protein
MTIEEVKEHFKDAVMVRDLWGDEFDYTKLETEIYLNGSSFYIDDYENKEMELYNKKYKTVAEILTTKSDKPNQDKPKHYQTNTIDVIDFATAYGLNFNLGSVAKYIARAGRKTYDGLTDKESELKDLEKAREFLDREIQTVKDKSIEQTKQTNKPRSKFQERLEQAIKEQTIKNK